MESCFYRIGFVGLMKRIFVEEGILLFNGVGFNCKESKIGY